MARVDFKQLEKFAEKLNKLDKEQIQRFNEATIKELAARLLRKVKLRTPVKSSDLRDKWTDGEVKRTAEGCTIDIINPMEYASHVEYGHRTRNLRGFVEGRFMLAEAKRELEQDAPQLIEKKLNRFLGGAFK